MCTGLSCGAHAQVEASLSSQLWRGVRFCLSLLVGLTVLTVVFEDKGLGRGMLNSPDMRPEQVFDVRFNDVKGVDEAKARPGQARPSICLQAILLLQARLHAGWAAPRA